MMKVVTHSSYESEYVELGEAGNEAVYLQQLQGEINIGQEYVLLLEDNESSLKLAINPVSHQRSKHVLLRYHSLRDKAEEGIIGLCEVDSGLNADDMMTKSVLKVCKELILMVKGG